MSQTTMNAILPAARRVLAYGGMLADAIEADRFARFALGGSGPIESNHPAFVLGHLCLYPARLAAMLRLEVQADPPEGWNELFEPGAVCRDDPEGSIYPACSELVERFTALHDLVLDAAGTVPDSLLLEPTPEERYRQKFPLTLTAVSFLLLAHPMFHLGQLSAWRRAEGLAGVT